MNLGLHLRGSFLSLVIFSAALVVGACTPDEVTPADDALAAEAALARNDSLEAARLNRKAAEAGLAVAQFNLGVAYDQGVGVSQDYAAAANWYRQAADQGNAGAMFNLALLYYKGRGVPQDYVAAADWYRKAADQGDVDAQNNLASMYGIGRGLTQDYATAAKWYRKAAEQGSTRAQFNLAQAYFKGQGVAKDLVQAHMWMNIASGKLQGKERDDARRYRDDLALKMTAAEIAEAQKMAREWTPVQQAD